MSSDDEDVPSRRHRHINLDSSSNSSSSNNSSIKFDPLSHSHFSRSQGGNLESEAIHTDSDADSKSVSFHSQAISPSGGPASYRQTITRESDVSARSESNDKSPTSDSTSLVFGTSPSHSHSPERERGSQSTVPADRTPALSILVPSASNVSKSPMMLSVPSNSSFKRRGSGPNENSVRIISPQQGGGEGEGGEVDSTKPLPADEEEASSVHTVDFPSPINLNTDSPVSPEPIKQQRPVKKTSPSNSSHNPPPMRVFAADNGAVRVPVTVRHSLTTPVEELSVRPAVKKVVYSKPSRVVSRVHRADQVDSHLHIDPFEELQIAKNEREATHQIKQAIQKDLDDFTMKMIEEGQFAGASDEDEPPMPSNYKPTPIHTLEERMCSAKIINKIYASWSDRKKKDARKSRSASPQKHRRNHSPTQGRNPPTSLSPPRDIPVYKHKRSSSHKPTTTVMDASFTPEIDPWKNTVKVVNDHLPTSSGKYVSAGDRLHQQGDIKRKIKDVWATRNKLQMEHEDVTRHSYHPVISDFARGVGVRTRRDDQNHHQRILEKKRQLYDRYIDADLDGCTFQPTINPVSDLLVPSHGRRKIHSSVYKRGIAMKKQRDIGVKELLMQLGDELPAPKSKRIVVNSHETQQWLQSLMRPRMGTEMYEVSERAHSQSRSQSRGRNRSRSRSPPGHLFYDAAEQKSRKEKMRDRDLQSKQESANVGKYIGSRSREMVDNNRLVNINKIFSLFDKDQTGFVSHQDMSSVLNNFKKFNKIHPDILNLLHLTRDTILPLLASSNRSSITLPEFTKLCLSKIKQHGLYAFSHHNSHDHQPRRKPRSSSVPVNSASEAVYDRLFMDKAQRDSRHELEQAMKEKKEELLLKELKLMASRGGKRSNKEHQHSSTRHSDVKDSTESDDHFGAWEEAPSPITPQPPPQSSPNILLSSRSKLSDREAVHELGTQLMRQQLQEQSGGVLRALFTPPKDTKKPTKRASSQPAWKR